MPQTDFDKQIEVFDMQLYSRTPRKGRGTIHQ